MSRANDNMSWPFSATSTTWPSDSSPRLTKRTMWGSSSTNRSLVMRPPRLHEPRWQQPRPLVFPGQSAWAERWAEEPLCNADRQADAKRRHPLWLTRELDRATVFFDDPLGDRQAKTASFR